MRKFYGWFGLISCLCALSSALVAYFSIIEKGLIEIEANAVSESTLIVSITNGFVGTYSEFQARYAEGLLPTPATFRVKSLGSMGRSMLADGDDTSVVGFPGREIAIAAPDEQLRQELIEMEKNQNTEALHSVLTLNGKTIHRTISPFVASDTTCVDCHNRLQNLAGEERWQLGDLMGAQYVDQRIDVPLSRITQNAQLVSVLVFLMVLAISYCCLFFYRQYQMSRKLRFLATTDSMTGCMNRREMYARIKRLSGRITGGLLMLDLDRFKLINDTYGHSVGDAVIKDFSNRVKGVLRSDDWVVRMGGEEFVVWLPDVKPTTALVIAERLRSLTESGSLELDGVSVNYTVSIGLHVVNNEQPEVFDSWIKAADALLYQAKSEGRNRIVFDRELMV